MSDTTHKTLAEALVAFQAEAPKLLKASEANAGSYRYKYVDLAAVMDAIQPLLAKHGLAWSAFPSFGPNGEPALRYKLTHSSGDCESETMPLLIQKADPQGLGSGISYARRYALTAVLNLVADEDDDGAAAARPAAPPAAQVASDKDRRLIYARADNAGIGNCQLANLVLAAGGHEPILFETEADGADWLERALPKLPARLVTPVVERIDAEKKKAA